MGIFSSDESDYSICNNCTYKLDTNKTLRNKIKTLNKKNIKLEMAIYDIKSQNKELIKALRFYCHTSSDINWKAMQTLNECGIDWRLSTKLPR